MDNSVPSPIIAFDLETTGLSPLKGDRVIEIGAVKIERRKQGEVFHSLIDCGLPIPKGVREINGITEGMLWGSPSPEHAFHKFRCFCGNATLVAHNAPFDRLFLQYEFSRLGWGLTNQVLCTLYLSRQKIPNLTNYRLETVARHLLGDTIMENRKAHRSLDDARTTAQIWLALEER